VGRAATLVIKAAKRAVTSWGRNLIVLNARDGKGGLVVASGAWGDLYLVEGPECPVGSKSLGNKIRQQVDGKPVYTTRPLSRLYSVYCQKKKDTKLRPPLLLLTDVRSFSQARVVLPEGSVFLMTLNIGRWILVPQFAPH